MTQPHLLDRGFRSHPRNPKPFTLPLPLHNIRERRSWEALPERGVGNGQCGQERAGCSRRARHTHQKGKAADCGRIGRPWRRSVVRLCVDAGPQAHPGSDLREAACPAPIQEPSQAVSQQDGFVPSNCPPAPSVTNAIKRTADKMPYNLKHGSEQTKGERRTLGDASLFPNQCLLLRKFKILLSRLKTFTK